MRSLLLYIYLQVASNRWNQCYIFCYYSAHIWLNLLVFRNTARLGSLYTDTLAFLRDSLRSDLHSNLMHFTNYSLLFSMLKLIWKIKHQTHAGKNIIMLPIISVLICFETQVSIVCERHLFRNSPLSQKLPAVEYHISWVSSFKILEGNYFAAPQLNCRWNSAIICLSTWFTFPNHSDYLSFIISV